MAKRKRLTPPDPVKLAAPETKGLVAPLPSSRPPIADLAAASADAAAVEELSRELQKARAEGRMIVSVPLDRVDLTHLIRDRVVSDEADLAALMQSLSERGQQTPVELVDLGDGRFGLISGWRRCQALTRLFETTQDTRFATVQGLLRQPKDAGDAYRAMVEENELRVGLSYFERARVVAKSVEQGAFPDAQSALRGLFPTASKAKRSKIGSFLTVVSELGHALRFPARLAERPGLTLSRALEADPALAGRIEEVLDDAAPETAEAEAALIAAQIKEQSLKRPIETKSEPNRPRAGRVFQADGIELIQRGDGALTLQGRKVTPELRDKLIAWLRS